MGLIRAFAEYHHAMDRRINPLTHDNENLTQIPLDTHPKQAENLLNSPGAGRPTKPILGKIGKKAKGAVFQ